MDLADHRFMYDPRVWSPDRLHASTLGRQRIAAAVAESLGYTDGLGDWTAALPLLPGVRPGHRVAAESRWLVSFFSPWLERRLTGRSSGDGRAAKHTGLIRVGDRARHESGGAGQL